jgi:hypothetical protein
MKNYVQYSIYTTNAQEPRSEERGLLWRSGCPPFVTTCHGGLTPDDSGSVGFWPYTAFPSALHPSF